ncbi:hypothetical protein TRFO_24576 [Tritrichomonas foetus]|uniref:Uncharacterized protein n=1 Tax=Tritrichomonas foetus TaxID=1144522 RepID=A0A1J4K771_9EUKA|nr:hypothetical protein TRFO_24576 [Tritrichomonas foetus]|eukprot:OHT07313.1 hypothetical protein TRFO_24576 [Tritrichomonas foetus]
MLFLLVSFVLSQQSFLPDPSATPHPSRTPFPTSVSGAPNIYVVWGSGIGAVAVIAASVSILCLKKDQHHGFANTAQILLEKNDI